jgi:hypothetical protein
MQPNCFGGIVHTPKAWHNSYIQPSGDPTGFWYSIWVVDEARPRGPFDVRPRADIAYNQARFEGHGTLLFFTNDAVSEERNPRPERQSQQSHEEEQPAQTPDRSEPALPELTQVIGSNGSTAYCDRSTDAYKEVGGVTGITPPTFLFSDSGNSDKVTWANGFKGTVPVCFVIDEHGKTDNIYFLQTVPKNIEDHLRTEINGWHYNAGIDVRPGDNHQRKNLPVRVQRMVNFTFR